MPATRLSTSIPGLDSAQKVLWCCRETLAARHPAEHLAHLYSRLSELAPALASGFPPHYFAADLAHYSRRRLFFDPSIPVSALLLTWAPGQATPVHDHAGLWCVEVVLRGTMTVTPFHRTGRERDGMFELVQGCSEQIPAGQGSYLAPPDEHHVMQNQGDEVAVSLHLYGGQMSHCNAFLPVDGDWYRAETRILSFSEDVQ